MTRQYWQYFNVPERGKIGRGRKEGGTMEQTHDSQASVAIKTL